MRLSARVRGTLLVSAVAALLVLLPLGQRPIETSDEARFPLLARDMMERGAWFDAQVREKLYRNKPPLYPWSIAAFSRLSGRVTEATAQAPVALAAIGAVLFTFLLGDRLFNRRAGLWAALMLATSYGFFSHSQKVLPDMLVLGFATGAAYAFWRATVEPENRKALVAFYAALAFGVFAKGPVGLLPLFVAAAWLWTGHGATGLRRLWSAFGVGIFTAITLSWLGPFLALGPRSFVESVLWRDWIDSYVGLPVPTRLANLAIDGILGFMPWTLLAPVAAMCAVRLWRDPAVRFALLWFAVPLLVVAFSENQRTRYLLFIYPGAALLTGWWADAHGAARTRAARIAAWGGLVGAGVAIALLARPAWLEAAQLVFLAGRSWARLLLAIVCVLAGSAVFWGLRQGRPAFLVRAVAAAAVLTLAYGMWLYTDWANQSQDFRRLAAIVKGHNASADTAVFGGRFFQIDFYLGRPLRRLSTVEEFAEYLARADHPVVVVNGRTWQGIPDDLTRQVAVLGTMEVRGQWMLVVKDGRDGRVADGAGATVRAGDQRRKRAGQSWPIGGSPD